MKRVISPTPPSPLPLASVTLATSTDQADNMGKNKGDDSGPDNAHRFQLFGLGSAAIAVIASMAWMAVGTPTAVGAGNCGACACEPQYHRQSSGACYYLSHVGSCLWVLQVSSGLILLNKDLLAHGFPYPMALSGLGMGFSGFASFLCCRVSPRYLGSLCQQARSQSLHCSCHCCLLSLRVPDLGRLYICLVTTSVWLMQVFKLVEAKRTVTFRFYVTKMLPVGLFMALTLHFGNLVYLYLTVSRCQLGDASLRGLSLSGTHAASV